jgi:hypothetical protein
MLIILFLFLSTLIIPDVTDESTPIPPIKMSSCDVYSEGVVVLSEIDIRYLLLLL